VAIPLLDLKAQYLQLKDELDAAIDPVMASGSFIGGARVKEFEESIAAYVGTKYAVGCASGTDAIIMGLEAMGIGRGDAVMTSPFSFFATSEGIARVGATPVFVDIEPDTFNIDPEQVRAHIKPTTKAIMPVHIFGQPADTDALHEIADPRGAYVVEDACQAIGADYKGHKAGALGRFAAFSFFPSKNLGGAGDGGMLTTDDEDLALAVTMLRQHGSTRKYFNEVLGHNSRLDALQAAILSVKLPHLDAWNEARRQAAAVYDELFDGTAVARPVVREWATSAYHLYVVRVARRDDILAALKAAGIGSGVYYPTPLHLLPAHADLGYKPGDLPVAEAASRETLALPLSPTITREEQEVVARVVLEAAEPVGALFAGRPGSRGTGAVK
jgi:dTDP-4-amino-4,6-dideoxygalactose transaminase